MVQASDKVKFFDPHFHIANWDKDSGTGHNAWFGKKCWLTKDDEHLVATEFNIKDYEALFDNEDPRTEHIGGMFIECGHASAGEVAWVNKDVSTSEKTYGIIGGCDLTKPSEELEALITECKATERFRGVRQCLNCDPHIADQWYKSENLLEKEQVQSNFKVLEAHKITFELSISFSMIPLAVQVLKTVPDLTVIVDHRGYPKID